jgi:predicted negative regulator of RcsB-dependent stress response
MNIDKFADISLKAMAVGAVVVFGTFVYQNYKFSKLETAEQFAKRHAKLMEESNAKTKQMFDEFNKATTRTRKAMEATMSDIDDILNGDKPIEL